ncbi:MAG TPA: hypothetical protein VIR15_04400 [Intrasporangium sp.]|uniref:hypothetical protein n=1 Tax=Intrasporangium sp. TaxID=1925024 RepID=UPI002F95D718
MHVLDDAAAPWAGELIAGLVASALFAVVFALAKWRLRGGDHVGPSNDGLD